MSEAVQPEHGGLPGEMVVVDDGNLTVDLETRARLEALLEAAGIGKLSTSDGKAFADPDVLHRLTSTVSYALDEAAAALSRLRAETGNQGQLRSLPEACSDGDVATVCRLLKEGQSIHETTEDGESLLSLACSAGYYELAEVLLSMHANTEERSPKGGCTPLMEAASGGYTNVVRLLIEHGADINADSSTGNTALTLACCGGYLDIVSLLIAGGADLEVQNENGHTPLMEAASGGHVSVAEILIRSGAGINTHSNEFKETALTLACYKGHLEMARFLLDAGADQEHKTDEMHTALMEASMDGHVEVAELLLDSGAQVNMPSDSFESPLTLAACGGHVALASLLLSRGANLEEVNDEGYTPLMEASREGHEEMVSILLSHGANVNAITEETRETALTLAACGGFMECCKLLIDAGAKLEFGCSTALMEAAQEGHLELVTYLIQQGASVDSQTSSGSTALSYACEHGRTDVADALLSAGAFLEHESEGGRTPLMKACRAGHICTVQYLLSRGANMNKLTRNKEHTSLSLACLYGHSAIVELLLIQGANPCIKLKDGSNLLLEASKGGHTTIVHTLMDLPRLPSLPAYPFDTMQTKSAVIDEYPSRVPTQALPIVVPPRDPDPMSPVCDDKACSEKSSKSEPSRNAGLELSELEERIKKIIETNVKLKVIESKPSLQMIHGSEDSRILKKQRILEELQKVEVDLQGKAAQQLQSCLDCSDFAASKMMERETPDGCELSPEEKDFSDTDVDTARPIPTKKSCDNVSPAASTFSLDKTSCVSDDCDNIFDVNSCTEANSDTALTLASAGGHVDLVKFLINRGADLEHRDKKGFTALILAATAGHVHIVNELLDAGANIESQSERTKDTPLSLACSGGRLYVVQTLVERGANIEHRNVSDYTPLSLAASGGYVRIIELLLHSGAEINSRTGSKLGISPLMLAAMNGHKDAVLTLLDMGADINAQIETNRNTALTLACFQGRHEVVSLLVDRRANVEHRAKTGLTPLMEAASGGYAEVGKVLLDKGSDPNAPPVPSSRDTALTIAADKGHLRFCELILSRGAIVDARNKKGNTSFWLACNGGFLDVAKLLVQHGAAIDAVDNRNITPLMAAFRRGHVKVVKWLSKIASHFPLDSECDRYMSTVTDRELLKRCHMCADCIAAANERQVQEANKYASALLEEIDKEKTREENRREKAARKREKRKKKRQEKQTTTKPEESMITHEDRTSNSVFHEISEEATTDIPVTTSKSSGKEVPSRPSAPTMTKSTSSQQQIAKKAQRKDEEWKEVVRKSKKVSVPSNLIARIIGRGGCNINAIREETGAHIDINRHKKGMERTITIRGPNNAIRHAYFLITELMKDENSGKDITTIFQAMKDCGTPTDDNSSKTETKASASTSSEEVSVTQHQAESCSSPPSTTSNEKKQSAVSCNTSSASESSCSSLNASQKKCEPSSDSMSTSEVQSSPASEQHTPQFNPKYSSKSINRPVQPVAPMIASTPKSVQSPATQTPIGLRSMARSEPRWVQNHQPSQHQVISELNNLSLADIRHMYPAGISGRQDNSHSIDSTTYLGECGRTVMHPSQTAQAGSESPYSSMPNTANVMQQRKMWPIGTERAFHQRRTLPSNSGILETPWHARWEIDNGMHPTWMNKQVPSSPNVHGNSLPSRENPELNTFSNNMPLMHGGSGIPGIQNVRGNYCNHHGFEAGRNHGIQLTRFPVCAPITQSLNYMDHNGLRINTAFSSTDVPTGQIHGTSTSTGWPIINRQANVSISEAVNPRNSEIDVGEQMKQNMQLNDSIESKSVHYPVDALSSVHIPSPGMQISDADTNTSLHDGASGSISYMNPGCNPIWKW